MRQLDNFNLICDQFEDVYQAGQTPDLAGFLEKVEPESKAKLLELLLPIDIEFRIRRFGNVEPDIYAALSDDAVATARKIIESEPSIAPVRQPVENNGSSIWIGQFRLLQKIGEGGMGEVWMAEQFRPVRRRVALKRIRPESVDKSSIARFDAERQALAMMDHQNIARVLEAGTSPEGHPWFAMELVTGKPITTFCDNVQLNLRQRLELFTQVCKAVQHAHQKGLIHRDLKPSNILVSICDGKTLPKIIDFGLAKAHLPDMRLTDKTMFTEFGQVIGTVQYMSPEQAVLDVHDIDTRSDIYSLGVILYELLVGSTPIDSDALKNKKDTLLKLLASIREKDPPLPSERLSQSQQGKDVIGRKRKISVPKLQQNLKGDLDWVVMKALDKDRGRRYETANEFAEDVQRFLDGEEIRARPASASYKLRKFIRRNRKLVIATAFAFVIMAAAATISSWFAIRAEQARVQAERASEESARSAKRSADVLAFVTKSFKSTDPATGATHDMTALEVLEKARELIDESELDDPGKADLLDSLTVSFLGMGQLSPALDSAEKALAKRKQLPETDDRALGNSMKLLARCYEKLGRSEEALGLMTKGLGLVTDAVGNDHPEAHEMMMELAKNRARTGDVDEALRLVQKVVDSRVKTLGDEHPKTIVSFGNLANCYDLAQQNGKALELRERTLELSKKAFGEDHAKTVSAVSNLANSYHVAGRREKALELREQVLEDRIRILGPKHPETLSSMRNLAISYADANRFADELKVKQQACEGWSELLGTEHPKTLAARKSLAIAYSHNHEYEKSIPIYRSLYEAKLKASGQEDPGTRLALTDLLWAQAVREENFESTPKQKERLKLLRESNQRDDRAVTLNVLALVEFRFGQFERAIETALLSVKRLPAEFGLPGPHPSDLAVLTLSYDQIGDSESSKRYRKQLDVSMRLAKYKQDPDCKVIALEVESHFEKRGSKAGSND